ncbi:ATP-binding cassette domain-containing protein [Roseateles sp. LYH14W]|uniref:ATP-binding cassette domain-containing protein n=1 Tax=Pelomonas parva TaxID=3299032 RepID=A0ABW7EYP1_9BURK
MPEPASAAAKPLDVAALARRPGLAAPLRSWRPGRVMRSLWRLLGARSTALAAGLLMALLRAGVLLLVSAAVGQVVRGIDVPAWAGVAAAGLLAAAVLGYAGQRIVIDAIQHGLTRLREQLVDRQLSLPVDVVLRHGAEGFVLGMTRDSELLGQMARACFGTLLPGAVLVLLCLGGIALTLPALALPLLLALSALWLVRQRLSLRLAAQMALTHEAIDQLYEQLGGSVLRHELAVSQSHESHEREACRATIAHTHALARRLSGTQACTAEVDALVLGLSLLGLLAWVTTAGGPAVSGPHLATVLFLLLALRSALQGLLGALQEMAQGMPALAGIERLLAMQPAPAHEGTVLPTRWRVTLEDVNCRVGGRVLFRNVDLTLEPGRIAVLTGENGAGKTTLLRVLLGLGEADSGAVCVDGVPWAWIDRAAFRRGVGYLPQNPVLFAGTVHDNIAYAAPGATRVAVQAAAHAVGLGVALSERPEGLATRLGPGGSPLSGGERQRVALARVLLRRPRLLVLDEPTNHLDAASAQALMALLRQLPDDPAVLIVSHAPALIAQADQVLAMVDGRLCARDHSCP